MPRKALYPVSSLVNEVFPADVLTAVDDALEKLAIDPSATHFDWTSSGLAVWFKLVVLERIGFDVPFIPGFSVHLGRPASFTEFLLGFRSEPSPRVFLEGVELTLHAPPTLLQAFERESASGPWRPVSDVTGYDFTFSTGMVADLAGGFELSAPELVGLPPFMIGDTGFVVELTHGGSPTEPSDVAFIGAEPPDRLSEKVPPNFQGLFIERAAIYYHKPDSGTRLPRIGLQEAAIGAGGFSGSVLVGDAREDPAVTEERLSAEDFDPAELTGGILGYEIAGMEMVLWHMRLAFDQSIPNAFILTGLARLPFVDKWMKFKTSVGGPNADFMVEVGGAGNESLVKLEHEWFEISADSIAYITKDDIHYAQISGKVKPKLGGLDWPSLKVDKLLIGSDDSVELEGGWLELPKSFTLDFHAFKIQLTQLGMGNEIRPEGAKEDEGAAYQWVGLSGSIALVEGLPISASVEGLKFTWPKEGGDVEQEGNDVEVSLTGIGLELEIPNTIKLSGSVSYKELKPEENPQGLSGHIFKGHVDLNIIALRTQVAGQLIIGRVTDADGHEFTVFYIALKAELPSPIVLGATGTGIYGMAGLFGMHIGPNRLLSGDEVESWYEWYKADRGESYSVVPVDKWTPLYDNYAFGAGLTLGTMYDDGFTINVKALVAVLIPGPVIMIEGKANLLKQRSDDKKEEGALYALVVFDGRAGTFEMNVDVRYSLEGVISVGGGLEAFFDFNDATAWYIHIGKKEPESKRIQAEILSIVKAKAYFMIDNFGLQTGAFVGVDWKAEYGPVRLAIVARFSFDASIFWKPLHLEGAIELYGEITLTVFGVGIELILQLLLEARAPSPYWIHGKARFKLSLFWPIPTIDLEAEFTWEEERPAEPVRPLLKGASMLHHKASGASWAIGGDGALVTPPEGAPIFPVDARPVLSFSRRLSGLPKGDSGQYEFAGIEADEVGDFVFHYRLDDVHLEVYDEGAGWQTVRKGINDGDGTFKIDDLSFINGWDAQEPQIELWRSHALDARSLSEREQFAERFPPCPLPYPAPKHCIDWQPHPEGFAFERSFRYRGVRFRTIVAGPPSPPPIVIEDTNVNRLEIAGGVTIHFAEPVGWLEVTVDEHAVVTAFFKGEPVTVEQARAHRYATWRVRAPVDLVYVFPSYDEQHSDVSLVSICYRTQADVAEAERGSPGGNTAHDEASVGEELILEPNRAYRLTVTTRTKGDPNLVEIVEHPDGSEEWNQLEPISATEHFYFRTDGGPGTVRERESPIGGDGAPHEPTLAAPHADTPVNTLAAYLLGTTPSHGATNHYYTYDLRLDFNEAYVRKLYDHPLEIRVRDRNGRLVKDENSNITGSPWGRFLSNPIGNMPGGWLTLLAAEEVGGCAAPPDPLEMPVLYRPAPRGLKPQRMYTAEVVTEGWSSPHVALHTVQFATSRYPDILAHLSSGRRDGKQVVRPHAVAETVDVGWWRELGTKRTALRDARSELELALTEPSPIQVHERMIEAWGAWDALHAASSAAFATTLGKAEVVTGPLPPALEFVPVLVKATNEQFLMLESPEPLDWARLSLTSSVPLRTVWNDDMTRAFVFHDEDIWLSDGTYELEFRYSGDAHAELPIISVEGEPVDVSQTCVVEL